MNITQKELTEESAIHEEESSSRKPNKLIALVSGGIVGVTLLAVLSVSFYTLATEVTWVNDGTKDIIYPVVGQNATIAKVDTYWIKKGEDFYVPYSTVQLSKKSEQGNLRFIYVNENDRMVGKPRSEEFQNAKFKDGNRISLEAEDGIKTEGMLNAYLTDQTDAWHLTILEAPSGSTSSSDFRELVKIPVGRTFKK